MSVNNTINLNGNNYVRFPKNDSFYPEDELTIAFDLYQQDWSKPQSSQIVGNFNTQGYGISFVNGLPKNEEIAIFDCGNNHLFRLNRESKLVSQRSLPVRDNPANITAHHVDRFGKKYYYDQANGIIFILNKENVVISEFFVTGSPVINIIKTNATGDVFVLDETNKEIVIFSPDGSPIEQNVDNLSSFNLILSQDGTDRLVRPSNDSTTIFVIGPDSTEYYVDSSSFRLEYLEHNNFVILSNGNVKTFFSNPHTPMLVDCDDNVYNLWGNTIYRNKLPWFFVPKGNTFGIDADENIWVVYNGNQMLKINKRGRKILDRKFHEIIPCEDRINPCPNDEIKKRNISYTKEIIDGGYEIYTWVSLEESNYILKLDDNANIIDCIIVGNLLNTDRFDKKIEDTGICVNGDLTGFYDERTFGTNCNDIGISKIVANIAILGFCEENLLNENTGTVSIVSIGANVTDLSSGYHSIRFSYSNRYGIGSLYIDNKLKEQFFLKGKIYYQNNNRSPVLVGSDSGIYKSVQEELGINSPTYFKGQIENLSIYRGVKNNPTSFINIDKKLNLTFPTLTTKSFKEKVDRVFLFRSEGFKSSRFDLNLINSGLTETNENIKKKIVDNIPSNVIIDEVTFEEDLTFKNIINND